MKILVFSLVMSLLITVCFAEINLDLEFSFPKLNNGLTGLELYDINEDGNDEIFAIYNGNIYNWELVCYSSIGDTLFTHMFNKEDDSEKIRKFKILKNTNYLLVVSVINSEPGNSNLYCKLAIYDLNDFTIIASITDFISFGTSTYNANVTSLEISDTNEGNIIFANIYREGTINQLMRKYFFNGSEIIYLEEYSTFCTNFFFDSFNNLFYSAELDHNYEYEWGPGGYESTEDSLFCNIKTYSNELISQIDTLFEISGFMHYDSYGDFYAIDYPVEFKLIFNNIGCFNESKIVFYRLANNWAPNMTFQGYFVCFSSDLSEILWEQDISDVSQNWAIDDTNCNSLILLDQEKYIASFRFNNEIILRSLENGEIIASDTSSVNPFIALTKSDSTNLFIEQIDDVYFAYSLNFTTSNNDDIINNNAYAYKISNHPNPFNPSTTIEFFIQNDSKVELTIYNIKGQKVKVLTNNHYDKGSHSVIWNGEDDSGKSMSSGVYFYKLNVNGKTEAVKKCLLLK